MFDFSVMDITGYLTRTKALLMVDQGLVLAARTRKQWNESSVTIDGVTYTCYTCSIYGKGYVVQIMCDVKMVSDMMVVLSHYPAPEERHDVWPDDSAHAIVFSGFNIACKALKQMYVDRYIDAVNMTGKGKYVEVQKCAGRNGRVRRYTANDRKGACMATDFYGLIPLHGINSETGRGSYPFDELYQAWLDELPF